MALENRIGGRRRASVRLVPSKRSNGSPVVNLEDCLRRPDRINKLSGKRAWTRYYWFSWADSAPSIIDRTIFIGSSNSLHVFAFNTSGKKLWQSAAPGWTCGRPAVGRTTVYAAVTGTTGSYVGPRSGALTAIGRRTGKLKWMIEAKGPDKAATYGFASAPLVADGRVFAADLDGTIYSFRDS